MTTQRIPVHLKKDLAWTASDPDHEFILLPKDAAILLRACNGRGVALLRGYSLRPRKPSPRRPCCRGGQMNAKTKPPSKRAQELARAMMAGYEDDPVTYLRLLVRRRAANIVDLRKAYEQGKVAREKRP